MDGYNKIAPKQYLSWIDVAKGIGIVLVVLGHSMFPKHILISGFHMPLFFILAGITFSAKTNFVTFINKKIQRILIPFFFWYTLSYLLGLSNGPLWFLYTLFGSLICVYVLIKYTNLFCQSFVVLTISLCIWGKYSFIDYLPADVVRILSGAIFVFIGYIYKSMISKVSGIDKYSNFKKVIIIGAVTLSIIYVVSLLVGERFGLYSDLRYLWLTMFRPYWIIVVFLTLCGSWATMLWAKVFKNSIVLRWLGINSLVIMCVHYPICEFLNINISKLPNFDIVYYKLMYAIGEYVITFILSAILVLICNNLIPRLSGGTSNNN